jgi:hypothetical protein
MSCCANEQRDQSRESDVDAHIEPGTSLRVLPGAGRPAEARRLVADALNAVGFSAAVESAVVAVDALVRAGLLGCDCDCDCDCAGLSGQEGPKAGV